MWRHPLLKVVLLIYIGWGGWTWSKDSIITHSANTHVIPQNKMIARQLSRLRSGQVVTLSGELVDGVRDDGSWIKTSLVRDDTGAGACEVLLVSDVALLP